MSDIQCWLFGVAITAIVLAGALNLFGWWSTKYFLGALQEIPVKLPKRKPEDADETTQAIAIVDLDLQLEHHQRGRCIAQSGLLVVAVIAIICATLLHGESSVSASAVAPVSDPNGKKELATVPAVPQSAMATNALADVTTGTTSTDAQ